MSYAKSVKLGYVDELTAIKQGTCAFCRERVNIKNLDDESRRQYYKTGFCKKCQKLLLET